MRPVSKNSGSTRIDDNILISMNWTEIIGPSILAVHITIVGQPMMKFIQKNKTAKKNKGKRKGKQ